MFEINNYVGRFKTPHYTRLSESIYLADNEDGNLRPIVTTATDQGINLCDVWHPSHMPYAEAGAGNLHRRVAKARHRKGCNVLYADWHVGWMAAERMTIDMWRFNDR
jgi:prepilin-type processing-associated H-X9-DG protein